MPISLQYILKINQFTRKKRHNSLGLSQLLVLR
jgi:hypothetical protein